MADVVGLKLKNKPYEVSQVIDFDSYDIDISKSKEAKLAIAQDIIDLIKDRVTSDNKGNDGRALRAYDKSYYTSEEFAAFNKSRGDVNMTLTGEMMASIDVLSDKGNSIEIGFTDALDNAKAHGHMTGFLGKSKPRLFFGVNQKEIDAILEKNSELIKDQEQSLTAYDVIENLRQVDSGKNQLLINFGIDNGDETI